MSTSKGTMYNSNNINGAKKNGASRYGAVGGARKASGIAWSQVDRQKLCECVGFVTRAGDAITFGCTSDGGAVVVTILCGADRYKHYAATVEEANALLDQIIDASGAQI